METKNTQGGWVYLRSEPNLFTVGHYDPNGDWHTDSDHNTSEKAANRVHWLNGGLTKQEAAAPKLLKELIKAQRIIEYAINLTPTGKNRNELTNQNITISNLIHSII